MDYTPKRVVDAEIFTVDYTQVLAATETIVSAVWTISPARGTDASASAMIQGVASIVGAKVSQIIKGGISGMTYAPICTAITSQGQTLVLPEYGNGLLQVTP